MENSILSVAVAQIAPVWLNKIKTIEKIQTAMSEAAEHGAKLVTFGETLLPGYPFWLDLTGGAVFNDPKQKAIHSHYLQQSIDITQGDLAPICRHAKQLEIAIVLGVAERAADRGGHSIYCSLVYIDKTGEVKNVHRKLMPTYEERLTWSPGDGHGLQTFPVGPFTMGGLNCWENWMPLARAALYGQGENLHVSIWPGGLHNTHDLIQVIAKEGRSFNMAVSGLMRPEDIPADTPYADEIISQAPTFMANGGSCIAAPDGSWLIEPQIEKEGVFTATLDLHKVYEERQSFDPVGHYSRPDVTQLQVNRERQTTVKLSTRHE